MGKGIWFHSLPSVSLCVSPPSPTGSPAGPDGVLPGQRRHGESRLLGRAASGAIGRERRRRRRRGRRGVSELGGSAADPGPDPPTDHTPRWVRVARSETSKGDTSHHQV